MPKKINEFLGYKIGDIITLSDIQTQTEFNDLSADFRIKEVRTYHEPADLFTYTGYIAEYQPKEDEDREPTSIMLLIRKVGDDFDILVYYLDQDGDVANFADHLITEAPYEAEEDEEDPPETTEDLVDSFEVDMNFEDRTSHVKWDKKDLGTVFGVEVRSTDTGEDEKTIAEYYTEDDAGGNPHCFIEWTGDSWDGYIELWYGCEVRPEDVEMFHT